jgi:hypothetical protein
MTMNFDGRVRVPDDVLRSNLSGESVLLNLKSETYFGLDEVGTRMWEALTEAPSIQGAFDLLKDEYDVEPDQLRRDLGDLVEKLLAHGLLEQSPEST